MAAAADWPASALSLTTSVPGAALWRSSGWEVTRIVSSIEAPWVANRHCLAAYLCYSTFANRIKLNDVDIEQFVQLDR